MGQIPRLSLAAGKSSLSISKLGTTTVDYGQLYRLAAAAKVIRHNRQRRVDKLANRPNVIGSPDCHCWRLPNGLKDQQRKEWVRPAGFDMLSGKYGKLGKLRFKAANAQHRPIGFFGPGPNEFTLLAWATERDSKYDPPDIRETALKRMEAIENGTSPAYDFDFEEVR